MATIRTVRQPWPLFWHHHLSRVRPGTLQKWRTTISFCFAEHCGGCWLLQVWSSCRLQLPTGTPEFCPGEGTGVVDFYPLMIGQLRSPTRFPDRPVWWAQSMIHGSKSPTPTRSPTSEPIQFEQDQCWRHEHAVGTLKLLRNYSSYAPPP